MRKFINLNKSEQNKLAIQFPDLLELVCVEETPHYSYLAISVFEDWLSSEAFVLDRPSTEEHKKRNNALFKFNRKLVSETSIINFKISGKTNKWHPHFRSFTSNDAKIEYLRPNDFINFKIVLPERGVVFLKDYKYTNVMHIKGLYVLLL